MKKIHGVIILFLVITLSACNYTPSTQDSIHINEGELAEYTEVFQILKEHLSKENSKLWNHQIYGPLLLIDKKSKTIIANEADKEGALVKNGDVYVGILPNEINTANTAINWNGKRWAMVMLPLPTDENVRLNLLIHELFHGIQPEIGFEKLYSKDCNHLDQLEGRVYLKMELEALKKALTFDDIDKQKKHVKNALRFRLYRQHLFSDAKENENSLEINEGLAEYTGVILSNRTDKEIKKHFIQYIDELYENPTFIRSFAYRTIPVYGYFMKQIDDSWNIDLNKEINLTDFIVNFFDAEITNPNIDTLLQIQKEYGYVNILQFENERDQKQKLLLEALEEKFQKKPVLNIPLQNMKIAFNPGNLIPFKGMGTVYPNLRIIDDWGVLSVENDALVSKNFTYVIISEPTEINENLIKGKGWELELNKKWKIEKKGQNYILLK